MKYTQFIFTELAEGTQPVEVLRVGTFRERNGRIVEITDADLDAFVANFDAGTAGQDVPVDVLHERAEAAGWVKRLFRDGQKLLAEIDWNEMGKQLVGDKVYRYLSATIDQGQKLIKSISLVNFPAVKGLQPVELGEGIFMLQSEPGLLERLIEVIRSVFSAESGPLAELVIRKEGNEIILYSSDGEKVLGRFPFGPGQEYASEEAAREAAQERERQVQYFKHAQGAEMEDDWAELQGNIKSIVGAWTRWAGSFTRCVRVLRGKPGISNEEALCAWLHKQAEGKWPAEGSEHSPRLMELRAVADIVLPLIAELDQDQEDKQMHEKALAELREQVRKEIEADMAEREQTLTELREQVRKNVEAELEARMAERQTLIEFAAEVCGEEGAALSVKPDELVEALEAIPAAEREPVMALLKAKVVEFGERGSGREGLGGKKALEEPYASQLREWLASGCDLNEWFKLNMDIVGDIGDYELSEFKKQE